MEVVNGTGCGTDGGSSRDASDEVGGAPTFAGLGSVAAMTGVCGLRMEWSAATSNCSAGPVMVYNVYRSTTSGFTPGAGNRMASCVTDLYYEDTTVVGGTPYYYVVRAEDSSAGHGGPCNDGFEEGNSVEDSGVAGGGGDWFEDFESGSTGWTSGGLWHEYVVDSAACTIAAAPSPTHAWWYGEDLDCEYSTGATTTGSLTTLVITGVTSTSELSFEYWREVESYAGAYDITEVEVRYNAGTWAQVWYRDSRDASAASWQSSGAIALSPPANPSDLEVRFTFNSVDGSFNAFTGWLIDDVRVTRAGGACATAPESASFFTATSTDGQNKLEWVNPSGGTYGSTMVRSSTAGYPGGPADGTLVVDQTGTAGAYDSYTHSGPDKRPGGVDAAFIDNGASEYSAMRTVSGRPQLTSGTVKWVYNTGATALAPPGIGSVYGVSNDRNLHSMTAGLGVETGRARGSPWR